MIGSYHTGRTSQILLIFVSRNMEIEWRTGWHSMNRGWWPLSGMTTGYLHQEGVPKHLEIVRREILRQNLISLHIIWFYLMQLQFRGTAKSIRYEMFECVFWSSLKGGNTKRMYSTSDKYCRWNCMYNRQNKRGGLEFCWILFGMSLLPIQLLIKWQLKEQGISMLDGNYHNFFK